MDGIARPTMVERAYSASGVGWPWLVQGRGVGIAKARDRDLYAMFNLRFKFHPLPTSSFSNVLAGHM
jgi:hypothetical protein